MKDIVELFIKIPGSFWGVVIGSWFTLIGVTLTNRANDRRLDKQLQNDRELKNREREMTFRKDTYAAGAEAIAASINALPKLCDLSISLQQISAIYHENSPALAKVNLVAGEDTILALAEFGRGLAGAFTRLSQQRMIFDILQKQMSLKAQALQEFEKTRDAMLELMRHHNIEGNHDHRRFEAIQEIYQFEAGRIATITQEMQQLVAELQAKHGPFAKECLAESIRVNRLLIPCLVAARTELELSISKEKYTEILNETYAHLEKQMNGFIENVAAVTAEQKARQ